MGAKTNLLDTYTKTTVLSSKLIETPFDILEADILDFNRRNGYFNNSGDALKTIFNLFDRLAVITTLYIPAFQDAPIKDNWSGWEHCGNHTQYGQLYWNWFFQEHPGAQLTFSDSPDFYGVFESGSLFWGDIGQVSASTFAMIQKGMGKHDVWISVKGDGRVHTIIETLVDIPDLLARSM
jgi:hypothetical protein